jgi:hypothetical protein
VNVRSQGITTEALGREVVVVTVLVLVLEEEGVVTGAHPNQLLPDGEAVRPSSQLHNVSLT